MTRSMRITFLVADRRHGRGALVALVRATASENVAALQAARRDAGTTP